MPLPFDKKPNFVLFYIDDWEYLRYWDESFPDSLGGVQDFIKFNTTWINKIRQEGFIFPYSYCGGPKCSPSRYSLLTGRYPSKAKSGINNILISNNRDPENGTYVEVPTIKLNGTDGFYNIQNILKTYANYTTGLVGKWHLLHDDSKWCGTASNISSLNISVLASDYDNCRNRVKEDGFDYIDGFYIDNIKSNNGFYSHNPEWMTDVAIKFMNNSIYNKNQSFFLYIAHTLTHSPDGIDATFNYDMDTTPRG